MIILGYTCRILLSATRSVTMRSLFLTITLFVLAACSSSPYKVVESLDNHSKPSWASLGKTSWKEDGKVWAVGMSEGIEPDRIIPLMRIADNNAKIEVTRLLANDIGADFKNLESGMRGEGNYSFLGSEKSQILVQELAPTERYYEKLVLKSKEDGPVKIYFYSLVAMPEETYNRILREAKAKAEVTHQSAPAPVSEVAVSVEH